MHKSNKIAQFKARFATAISDLLGISLNSELGSVGWRSIYYHLKIVNEINASEDDSINENLLKSLKDSLFLDTSFKINVIDSTTISNKDTLCILQAFHQVEIDPNVRGDFVFGPYQNDKVLADRAVLNFHHALSLIEQYLPDYFEDVAECIEEVMIVGPVNKRGIRSGSTINTFGCIVNRPDGEGDILQFVEDIIHETTHHKIYIEQLDDEIILSDDNSFFSAPFRDDKVSRPLSTQYHSAHVCAHAAIALDQLSHKRIDIPQSNYDIETNVSILLYWHKHCCEIVFEHAELTPRGSTLLLETIQKARQHFGSRYAC